jgi:hypothetical protein
MWGSSGWILPTVLYAPRFVGAGSNLSLAASTVNGIAPCHSKHRIRQCLERLWSSPSLRRDTHPGGRPEHYLQGRFRALAAHAERGPSTWRPTARGTAGTLSRLDDGVCYARHLGGERRHRLAATVGIVRVPSDVSSELVGEAIVALTRGDLCGRTAPKISRKSIVGPLPRCAAP